MTSQSRPPQSKPSQSNLERIIQEIEKEGAKYFFQDAGASIAFILIISVLSFSGGDFDLKGNRFESYFLIIMMSAAFLYTIYRIIKYIKGRHNLNNLEISQSPFFEELEKRLSSQDYRYFKLLTRAQKKHRRRALRIYELKKSLILADLETLEFIPLERFMLKYLKIEKILNQWRLVLRYLTPNSISKTKKISFEAERRTYKLIKKLRELADDVEIGRITLKDGEDTQYLVEILGNRFEGNL
jgi:hypothetical protein